jgi:16S rRNA (cytidine1402-2'-O)-methyltransferase
MPDIRQWQIFLSSCTVVSMLYIVATPIGNLEDISGRALRILAEVDLIACEDTRHSLKLLNHYGLKTPMSSFHSHNMKKAAPRLLELLLQGKDVALITDGGTPGVSDPGSYLVALAREKDVRVVPVPGASALSALLSVSGAATGRITFAGFLSPKGGRRRGQLKELLERGDGLVMFESPHRILKLLADLQSLAPKRECLIGREMTKVHEEFLKGIPEKLLTELQGRTKIKGEFSLFVMGDKKHQVECQA